MRMSCWTGGPEDIAIDPKLMLDPTLALDLGSACKADHAPANGWRPRFEQADMTQGLTIDCGGKPVDLFLAYYAHEREGAELIHHGNRLADGKSWTRLASSWHTADVEGLPASLKKEEHYGRGAGDRLVLAWYWIGGRLVARDWQAKAYRLYRKLIGKDEPAALIALSAPYTDRPEDALSDIEAVLEQHKEHCRLSRRTLARGPPAEGNGDGMMRVLHVLNHGLPTQDGYVYRTHGLLEGQRAHGIKTFHLTSPRHEHPAPTSIEKVEGWEFFRTPDASTGPRPPLFRELMEMRATQARIAEIAADVRPDVIQAHSPLLNGYPALWAARRLGIPVVYEIRAFWEDAAVDHGTTRENSARYRVIRKLETALCQRVDAVTTICRGLADALIIRGIDAKKIEIVPNAVDPGRFSSMVAPDPSRVRELGLEGCTVLGFIGSFYTYEGLALLIDAMPALLSSHPDLRLLLIGGGQDETPLRARATDKGLEKKVIFTGRIPQSEVPAHYSLVDLCVYPRLPMPLTDLVTPLKPLEAMAAGRIVVASDVGGHLELIRHGETGFLYKAGYLTALIDCVRDALASRERWPQIRADGRLFVTERSWQSVTGVYRPLFERLSLEKATV